MVKSTDYRRPLRMVPVPEKHGCKYPFIRLQTALNKLITANVSDTRFKSKKKDLAIRQGLKYYFYTLLPLISRRITAMIATTSKMWIRFPTLNTKYPNIHPMIRITARI